MWGRCAPPTSHRLQRVICRPATRKRSPPPRSKHPPGCGQRSSRSPTQRWAISMDKVALLPATDRAALFGETGAGRGVVDTIIEKDFWVCWTLKRLFGLQGKDAAIDRKSVV